MYFFNNEKIDIHVLRESVFAEGKEQCGNDIMSKPTLHTFGIIWYGELQYVVYSLSRK